MSDEKFIIERIDELDLTASQDVAIAELVDRIFNADMNGQSFAQNRHHRRYTIWQNGTLAGHLAVCFRVIRLGEEVINAVGIAEVVVDIPFRRKGMASAMLNAALEDGQSSLADFALLFGVEPLYQRAGFRHANNTLTLTQMFAGKTGTITRKADGSFMIKAIGAKRWNDDVDVDLAGFAF